MSIIKAITRHKNITNLKGPRVQDIHIDVQGSRKLFRQLITASDVAKREELLGKLLADTYATTSGGVHVLSVMSGANSFAVPLRAAMQAHAPNLELTSDYVHLQSYSGTKSSGNVRYIAAPHIPIKGKHVLVVEDIIDTGKTIRWLMAKLAKMQPASLALATLLHKPDVTPLAAFQLELAQIVGSEVPIHVGFNIGKEFVLGHGLDYNQRYRDLPGVYAMVE